MSRTRTPSVLSVAAVTAGLGLCWWLGQYNAQGESPTDARSGRKGAEMDESSKSSLINPLSLEGKDDGIFPKAAAAALNGPGGTVPSLARVGEPSNNVKVTVNGFPVDSLGQLKFEDDE